MNITQHRWLRGRNKTLDFWRSKLPLKTDTFNKPFPLVDYFISMIGDKKEVSILDVGSGACATTGSLLDGVIIDLHPCDMLADEFARMYEEAGITPLFPIEKQDMEHLTYSDNSFDIVHCANALDHCIDPFKAICEMVRVCKVGGWVYLKHFVDEGIGKRYTLQHQWNIRKTDHNCLFWNYERAFMLSEAVKGFKTTEQEELDKMMVISTLQKI